MMFRLSLYMMESKTSNNLPAGISLFFLFDKGIDNPFVYYPFFQGFKLPMKTAVMNIFLLSLRGA
ncbi:hypothetical protein SAMN04488054_10620 [Salibacterium qingdaonense]|uniref:Uncharacterized protein n=1 Tax=Salibacterium qingdaonense TaxID=266892 RepID=A0A1I4KW40_9BACI|nr:hypothetical protein SAMN04488054_10620 [Salibacterium qingdaonense]